MIQTLTLSVLPTSDKETADALGMLTLVVQSLAAKGIDVSLSVNTYGEDDEPEPDDEVTES